MLRSAAGSFTACRSLRLYCRADEAEDSMQLRNVVAVGAFASLVLLAGCASDERGLGLPTVANNAPPKLNSTQLVGRWGLCAYHRDTDRARTIPQSKAQCSNAYVIAPGS